MRALVTGATGFIGRSLVESLLDRGDVVSILTRKTATVPARWLNRVRVVVGDVRSDRLALPDDVDCVLHCAGALDDAEARDVNVHGTRRIVEHCVRTPSIMRLVYLSSVGVIGATGPGVVDETTECAPRNAYEASKLEAERMVLSHGSDDLVCTALRPSIVFGYRPPDRPDSFRQLVDSIGTGRFRLIGAGHGIYNLVFVDDVAAALVTLSTAPRSVSGGRAFIINDPIRFDTLAEVVASRMNAPAPRTVSPAAALPLAVGGTMLTAAGLRFPLTLSRYRAMTSRTWFSGSLLAEELGFRCPFGTNLGVAMTMDRYRDENPQRWD